MDFIVDNYFWFIVGGVVILMIIIGYIAEKTDFGRKPFKEKKVDNGGNNEVIINEEPVENVVENENSIIVPEDGIEESIEVMEQDDLSKVAVPAENFESLEPIAEEENEEFAVEDVPAEETVEEPMVDLDIPEITSVDNEGANEVTDVVEEVIADDSEDDVWKF